MPYPCFKLVQFVRGGGAFHVVPFAWLLTSSALFN